MLLTPMENGTDRNYKKQINRNYEEIVVFKFMLLYHKYDRSTNKSENW